MIHMFDFYSFFIPAIIGVIICGVVAISIIVRLILQPRKNLMDRIDTLEKEVKELKESK